MLHYESMKLKLNNQIINFEFYESGKNRKNASMLVFLHGWQRNLKDFEIIAQNLIESGYNVLSIDLPGFGQSSLPDFSWETKDYADFLKLFLEKLLKSNFRNFRSLTSETFILVGHSFGGRVAIKFAAKYPELIKKLVLIASPGVKHKSIKYILYRIVAKAVKNILTILGLSKLKNALREKFSSDDYLKSHGIMKEVLIKTIDEDLTDDAGKIQAPVLIIWGKNDKELQVKDAFILYKTIKNSQIEIFENAGHFVFLDKPKEFLDAVKKFII